MTHLGRAGADFREKLWECFGRRGEVLADWLDGVHPLQAGLRAGYLERLVIGGGFAGGEFRRVAAPHGLLWTHADEVNDALLAFLT